MTRISDLNPNQRRIFKSVRNKGYNVSPKAIVANDFEGRWNAAGAFGGGTPTTTTAGGTPTTTTP